MAGPPSSWAETLAMLAVLLGGTPADEAASREWLRQALVAVWGVQDVLELSRVQRALALQRLLGTVYALQDEPFDYWFGLGVRAIVARSFARFFGGFALDGPPWSLDPSEVDRPSWKAWSATASSFEGALT